jgi:hypothetical protein
VTGGVQINCVYVCKYAVRRARCELFVSMYLFMSTRVMEKSYMANMDSITGQMILVRFAILHSHHMLPHPMRE